MVKSVIIYAYFMSPSSDYNLDFFIKKELKYRKDIDYIVIINGYEKNKNLCFPSLENLKVIERENIGYDFGAHNCALEYIQSISKTYDYYFFMNSGVIGPVLSDELIKYHWTDIFISKINDRVKLVGTVIACLPHGDPGGYGPKVECFFFMVDEVGLSLLKNEKTIFCNHGDKYGAIVNGEYAVSKCIFRNGYTIDCMMPEYQNIDWTNENNYILNNNRHPSRVNSFYGYSLNPYDLIFHKWFWHGQPTVNFDVIQEYVNNYNESNNII